MLDDSTAPVNARVADDWCDLIDLQFLPTLPRWHRGFDGKLHATPEALDRLEADLLFAGEREAKQ